MPLFVWSMEVYAALLVVVLPALSAGLTMLLLDRQVGNALLHSPEGRQRRALPARVLVLRAPRGLHHDPARDGDHLRGHPRLLAQADLRLHGDRALDARRSRFYSMLVWAHHMFAVGLPGYLQGFFMISSMIIAVPTGIKIFNWLATTWRGNIHFDTPMLFALGFIARLHDRRPLGNLRRRRIRSTGRPPTRTSSSRTCTTCSSAGRSSGSSPGSTTGGPRCSGACSTSGWARSASGSSSSA